jgi:DNA polymerase-3 subunit alpha
VGKNLTFGGIINDVQHRIAKTEKAGIFTLEGYDESYEFKIFGEEYLSSVISLFKTIYLYESIGQRGLVNQDTKKK